MPNSSSSDSDDDTDTQKIRLLLEAADTTLLTNALFQQTPMKLVLKEHHSVSTSQSPRADQTLESNEKNRLSECDALHVNCKSERYLVENHFNSGADIIVPAATQQHIFKKLTQLIGQKVVFCNMTENEPPPRKHARSKVKLLREADCYVKPYEEFEFLSRGPKEKPLIKRRTVDNEENKNAKMTKEDRLQAAVVEPESILEGLEVKTWAKKPERKDKVYHYTLGGNGQLHVKEPQNEFIQLRRKNKWNERKISQKIKQL